MSLNETRQFFISEQYGFRYLFVKKTLEGSRGLDQEKSPTEASPVDKIARALVICFGRIGAGDRTRTDDLLITNWPERFSPEKHCIALNNAIRQQLIDDVSLAVGGSREIVFTRGRETSGNVDQIFSIASPGTGSLIFSRVTAERGQDGDVVSNRSLHSIAATVVG
jgi:hypothetical protein